MLILIDLDGTILKTLHPTWKPYRDGVKGYLIDNYLDKLPFVKGAKEFILEQQQKGNKIVIVSDSHPRYVEPICRFLNLECVSLCDKPNKGKLSLFLEAHSEYKTMIENDECFLIGDTEFDIELGRRMGMKTIWIRFYPYQLLDEIKNKKDGIDDGMGCKKMGPTYTVTSFAEVSQIIENPLKYLYTIESRFVGENSINSIRYGQVVYADRSYAIIRCLARQESGISDKYACADKYYFMSNPNRTAELIHTLAKGVSLYLNRPDIVSCRWDYFTYLTDKKSTIPQNKMKEIFDLVETNIPKVQLLKWRDNVEGSLRNKNLYNERKEFLENSLYVDAVSDSAEDIRTTQLSIEGKNIVVLDDQLTTSATAWHVIHLLKEKGANNILFIAMFQMTVSVESDILCPKCGKPMLVKIRREDGHKFYSCVPPEYKGTGCGYIIDNLNQ